MINKVNKLKGQSMKKKLTLYIAITLITGVFGGYLIAIKNQSQQQLQTSNQVVRFGYENGTNQNLNKENCLADDCLLVEDVEYPVGELSQEVQIALDEAINDEYKALSTYEAVIAKFGTIRPFSMIKGAEEQHIASLKAIYDKYGLEVPVNSWSGKVIVPATLQEACQIGVEAEIANAALYRDELLPAVANYEDIILVFENLMNASQQKHLPAFNKCN
jgi:hypothetical protein